MLSPNQFARLSPRQRMLASVSGLGLLPPEMDEPRTPTREAVDMTDERSGALMSRTVGEPRLQRVNTLIAPEGTFKERIRSVLTSPPVGSGLEPRADRPSLTPSADELNYRNRPAAEPEPFTHAQGSNRFPDRPDVYTPPSDPREGMQDTRDMDMRPGAPGAETTQMTADEPMFDGRGYRPPPMVVAAGKTTAGGVSTTVVLGVLVVGALLAYNLMD